MTEVPAMTAMQAEQGGAPLLATLSIRNLDGH